MQEKCGHSMGIGFIFKKINYNYNIKERKRSWGPFRIYQLISTANSAQFHSKISPSQGVEYIRDIRNIRSPKRIEAHTEIQSSNMFRS